MKKKYMLPVLAILIMGVFYLYNTIHMNTSNTTQSDTVAVAIKESLTKADTIDDLCQGLQTSPYNLKTEMSLNNSFCGISLPSGIDARDFSSALGWERPYAVSGDVHQHDWSIMVWRKDMGDQYGKRIAVDFPHIGRWKINAILKARPEGELPQVVAGASPAYDLATYKAEVILLEIQTLSQ